MVNSGRGACEELDGQMGPTVAESEIGLALSGGPDLRKVKGGDAMAERGLDTGVAVLLVAGSGNAVAVAEFGRPEALAPARSRQRDARSMRFLTVVAYHPPPRAVRIPRRLSSSAIP